MGGKKKNSLWTSKVLEARAGEKDFQPGGQTGVTESEDGGTRKFILFHHM